MSKIAERDKDVLYRVARTKEEMEQAFSLVYKEYAARRYIPMHYKSKMRLSLFNAAPKTTTFIAVKGKKIVATVTLIPDTPLGLPMDKIYKDECDTLRKKGRRIAECSQLAVDSKLFPKGWFSMFNFSKFMFVFKLFKILLDYGIYIEKSDDYCIAINPKQQHLYNFIGFEKMGGLKYYGSVNRAPAIAKRLDLNTFEKRSRSKKGLHHVLFGYDTPPDALKGKFVFSGADLKYFFLEKSGIFEKASKEQLEYIKSCYPGVSFKERI